MSKTLNKKLKANRFQIRRGIGGLCLLMLSASCVPGGVATRPVAAAALSANRAESQLPPVPPPAPEPLMLGAVAPETAIAMNASIPIAEGNNPAARAFLVRTRSFTDKLRSLDCLTTAIYYEAASESDDGQRAVAQVVLNRVRHPTYPNSVCGVVYQGSERSTGCQFSFTCDGSLARVPAAAGWARARRIAAAALAGSVYAPVGLATHYHTYRVFPHWASSLVKSAVIGAHIFYRWNGGWGAPAAFRQAYAGAEPLPGPKPQAENAPAIASAAILHAELAALAEIGRQAESQRLASAPVLAPAQVRMNLVAEVSGGPRLPDSQVREEYRDSGMPRDQLPGAAR
jgi:spore germination cell wall hydrolase CwlJ-like protein